MRESEIHTKTFQADNGRTAIVVESEAGKVQIDLLLDSRTGKIPLSAKDLDQLVEVIAAANNYVKATNRGEMSLATE